MTACITRRWSNRDGISLTEVIAGLTLAPLAWLLQLDASYVIGSRWCRGASGSSYTGGSGIGLIAVMAIVLGFAALLSAWRSWSVVPAIAPDHPTRHDVSTKGFLALCGLIVSSIFLIAQCFVAIVPLLVRSCGP